MTRAPRGQNLVLMALTMLLLTLMVLGTLGIAQRLRENHELQNVADAAAYSSAVQNARAFNNIAILNRLQVSLWVAQAADESLISWASYARAAINAAMNQLEELARQANNTTGTYIDPTTGRAITTYPCSGVASRANAARAMLATYRTNIVSQWGGLDDAAGAEAKQIQFLVAGLRNETRAGAAGANCQAGPGGVCGRLFDERRTQAIAERVVQNAKLDGVVVHAGGKSSSEREVDCGQTAIDSPVTGRPGLCIGGFNMNMLEAAMGSRGNSFVTGRGVMPPYVQGALNAVTQAFPELAFTDATPTGSGYWSGQGEPPPHATALDGTYAWGDDHGGLGVSGSSATCAQISVAPVEVKAHVWSTDEIDAQDQHKWFPAIGGGWENDQANPTTTHTMGDCTPYCPSVWVAAVGFHPAGSNDADAYGQPKVTVLLERDTTALPRPWELNFKFRFAQTGQMSGFDNRGRTLHGGFSATNIQHQYAFATGIAYYHRKGHWVETPNLLNPFWRATLVASDVDEQGQPSLANNDVETMLPGWRAQAYRELVNAGFRGFQ